MPTALFAVVYNFAAQLTVCGVTHPARVCVRKKRGKYISALHARLHSHRAFSKINDYARDIYTHGKTTTTTIAKKYDRFITKQYSIRINFNVIAHLWVYCLLIICRCVCVLWFSRHVKGTPSKHSKRPKKIKIKNKHQKQCNNLSSNLNNFA